MKELAFVFINPYTIAKSRTGGVISRYLARTDLNFKAARMFGPSQALVDEYADLIRSADDGSETCKLIANYISESYAPDPDTGRPRRVMMLLFEGEQAVRKIWDITGSATLRRGSGETVRDTYGDYVLAANGSTQYFEPAVLVGPTKRRVEATLCLWAKYSEADGGLIESAGDVPHGESVEKTLVILKPDNFRRRSLRAGNIIDILSSSGLRIVAVNKFSMTVAQAEQFYGPVQEALKSKFYDIGSSRVASSITREFGFEVPEQALRAICEELSHSFAATQFDNIVHFMTGYRPSECSRAEKSSLASEECFGLVYEGINAVEIIRGILGPTDPKKAQPGSVRREFGSDVMVNAAHASDSPENAQREMDIIDMEKDRVKAVVQRYCGNIFTRLLAMKESLPQIQHRVSRNVRMRFKQGIKGAANK